MRAATAIRQVCRIARGLGVVFVASGAALAQDIPGYPAMIDAYDAREVAMLPRYCAHTQLFRDHVPGGNNNAEIARWQSVIGSNMFQHMHHYCWGLMKTNRAVLLSRSQQVRMSYLSSSISEFEYVINHAPADFVLLPEILSKKGENLIRMGKGPLAILDLERAAELKPDYWPPYAHLSDFYKEAGDKSKAREALERGLSFAPDATGLKRRLAELQGGRDQERPPAKASEVK